MKHNPRTLAIALAKTRHHGNGVFYARVTPAEALHLFEAGAQEEHHSYNEARYLAEVARGATASWGFWFRANKELAERIGRRLEKK